MANRKFDPEFKQRPVRLELVETGKPIAQVVGCARARW